MPSLPPSPHVSQVTVLWIPMVSYGWSTVPVRTAAVYQHQVVYLILVKVARYIVILSLTLRKLTVQYWISDYDFIVLHCGCVQGSAGRCVLLPWWQQILKARIHLTLEEQYESIIIFIRLALLTSTAALSFTYVSSLALGSSLCRSLMDSLSPLFALAECSIRLFHRQTYICIRGLASLSVSSWIQRWSLLWYINSLVW